ATHKRVLLGLEIAVDCLRLVAVSLSGVVLGQSEIALDDRRPANACQLAVTLLGQHLRQLEQQQLLLSGVGVCLPGAIDAATGMVRLAPNLGWRDVPFLDLLTAGCASQGITRSEGAGARSEMLTAECASRGITAVPIHLQNDADSAAVGEYEFGSGSTGDITGSSGANPLIFVNCDVGVGAGIVLNDRLYTGFLGAAGEIGHSILQVNGPLCSCGRRGCAEAFVGARVLQQQGGAQQAGHYLGMVLQNLDATFNPRVIVLGGRSIMENPGLLDAACQAQLAYAQTAGMQAPVVRATRFGLQAAAVGAAALVLHQFLRPLLKETRDVPGY
ncbi:MAG: ROK family protein, partial [Rhodoferax sp.]|nr:ROK family protein [Rhodoferax sp.]